MICRAGHGDDQQCLNENANGKCVHSKTGGINFQTEDIDNALSLFWIGKTV